LVEVGEAKGGGGNESVVVSCSVGYGWKDSHTVYVKRILRWLWFSDGSRVAVSRPSGRRV
jgi:hypothetical protein